MPEWKNAYVLGIMGNMNQRIEISQKSIMFTFVVIFGVMILHQLKDLLVLLFLCTIFASALNPLVKLLQKYVKLPRPFSIMTVYLLFVSLIVALFSFVLPPFIQESMTLVTKLHLPQLPETFEFSQLQDVLQSYNSIVSKVGTSLPSIMNAIFTTFSGVLVVFSFLVITYYMLIERHNLHHYLIWFFGTTNAEKRAKDFIDRVEFELGGWVRGELLLMLIVGVLTYIGLLILGIPYALPLAILAGLLEVVPNIGPTISSVPAIILTFFTISPTMALAVVLLYVIVQQLENNLIVPKIMGAAVNISPLVAIIALISGMKLGGWAGAVLAIPTFIFLRAIVREFYHGKNPLRTLDHDHVDEK